MTTQEVCALQDEEYREYALDPFLAAGFMYRTKKINSWWFALTFPIIGCLVILACAVEGTLGSVSDFQLWADLRRIFGDKSVNPSAASFPLARDVTSWFFLFVASVTCVLVHRQWQLMEKCIPEILRKNALKRFSRDPQIRYRRIHRLLLLPRVVTSGQKKLEAAEKTEAIEKPAHSADQADIEKSEGGENVEKSKSTWELKALIKWVDDAIADASQLRGVVTAIAGCLLTFLVIFGENKNGLFQVLEPYQSNAGWLKESYESWWASTAHPLGLFAYLFIILLGIFVALLQNIVGIFCTYVVLSFSAVAELDADWLNRDGSYGWKPIARVYRTVVLSLALHGLTISVALVSLGFKNFPWIFGIVAIWVVVFPLYLIFPYFVFNRVGDAAKRRRIEKIEECFPTKDPDGLFLVENSESEITKYQRLRDEIREVHAAKINPLRIRPVELPVFVIAVILPVLLTAVQVFFSVKYGSSGGK